MSEASRLKKTKETWQPIQSVAFDWLMNLRGIGAGGAGKAIKDIFRENGEIQTGLYWWFYNTMFSFLDMIMVLWV